MGSHRNGTSTCWLVSSTNVPPAAVRERFPRTATFGALSATVATLLRCFLPRVYSGSVIRMADELDSRIAERLASSAISRLQRTSGEKVLCTRGALKRAILEVARV